MLNQKSINGYESAVQLKNNTSVIFFCKHTLFPSEKHELLFMNKGQKEKH